tara:strand:+ start:3780 stop:4088 length:309 start_codon:yes stop_codon:yes gene_type:complete
MKLIDKLVQSYTEPTIRENSMAARRAGAKRVHHSDKALEKDQIALIDYLWKNPDFQAQAVKKGYNRDDIYFDDNELVFGSKTGMRVGKNDKVSDIIRKVKVK